MSVYKGDKVVAGGSVDTYFVRKPAWSQAVAITAADILAGYTAPEDGIIIIDAYSTGTSTHAYILLNGVSVGLLHMMQGNVVQVSHIELQVNKGDIVSKSGATISVPEARFIPFEDSTIAEPEVVTPELIRNLHDPDWSNAVTVSSAQLIAGYTTPGRGIMCITFASNSGAGNKYVTVNGVIVGMSTDNGNWASFGNVQVSVSQGDIVKANANTAPGGSFVPYKAQ